MPHTKGPWKIADEEIEIVGGMGFHKIETVDQTIHEGESPCPVALAYCIDTHVFEHLGDSEENAKLIAAAPDLKHALQMMLDKFENDVLPGESGWDAIEAARAALGDTEYYPPATDETRSYGPRARK